MKKRVVITGIGIIAPCGIGKEAFWKSVSNGISGVKRIESFDPSEFPCRIAGEVRNLDALEFIDLKKARRYNRITQFGIVASKMAIDDAGLEYDYISPNSNNNNGYNSAGIILGTCYGGMESAEDGYNLFFKKGWRKVKPNTILQIMYNVAASYIAIELGLRGPNLTVATACSSSTVAIGQACNIIRDGYCNIMLAGGADAPIKPGIFSSWVVLNILSENNDNPENACRPFSKDRDGIVLSEGAAINDFAYDIPISATKSIIGHTMGASGAIGLTVTVLSMKNNLITPTINYNVPDPECDLDYVPNEPREAIIFNAISNAFGFGGTNAVLVVQNYNNRTKD